MLAGSELSRIIGAKHVCGSDSILKILIRCLSPSSDIYFQYKQCADKSRGAVNIYFTETTEVFRDGG